MGSTFEEAVEGTVDSIDEVEALEVKKWVDDLRMRPSKEDLSRHALSEIVVSQMIGRLLRDGEAIPGCECESCETRRWSDQKQIEGEGE